MSLFSRRTSGMELLFRLISLLACSGFVWERAGQMPKGKHKYHVYTLQREKGVGGIPGYRYSAGCVLLVGFVGCEVRLCGPCAFVRPRVPCVSCVSRLPPVSLNRYST